MRSFLITLALLAIIAAGLYLYFRERPPTEPAATAETEASPEETADTATAGAEPPADTLEQEARDYIRDLTALQDKPLAADNADNFVQRDQNIRLLPSQKTEEVTPRELTEDPSVEPDTPLTVIKEVERVEIVTVDKLREAKGNQPDQPLKVMEGNTVKETTLGAVLEEHADAPETPITIVRKVEEVSTMTVTEIQNDPTLEPDEPLRVMRGHRTLDEATVAELMMGAGENDADDIYYVRTVKDTDRQGIWGIIHYGLIDNFARGIAIRRGEDINTYRVDIPQEADEMVSTQESSFLGRMIFDKSQNSYVYNLQQGRIGQNPHMIRPGQELLIIRFSPEELVDIYKHFVNSKNA